jgi:ribosomal-protein-alanine N-acetyltransferase
MRTLVTQRVQLEPQLAAHAAEMFQVLGDPAIYEYENDPPRSPEALRQRYTRLEGRLSPDGKQQWLNWVLRLRGADPGPLIGYVQATLAADSCAIAYELNSAHWHQGLAREACTAMIEELAANYQVRQLHAVLKSANQRSHRLLTKLGFAPATAAQQEARSLEPDEMLMLRDLQGLAGIG